MKVIHHKWKWAYPLTRRTGRPTWVDWHHAAAKTLTPARLHALHLSLGWCGFGYNFYIRKNGSIHIGRPLAYCGGGALEHWSDVGVCLEGNYDTEKAMPKKQLRAAQELHDYLAERYPAAGHRGHRDVPSNATACPGRHFPFKAIREGVPDEREPIRLTSHHVSVPRMNKVKAGWRTVGFQGWYERLKKQGDGHRVVIYKDHVILPVPAKLPWWWDEMLEFRKSRTVIIVRHKKPTGWLWRHKP
jgi:hypothetical protein